jgi:hypothetical protein
MTIFAGGSSPVSGITRVCPQSSFALCAKAADADNAMAATHSRDAPVEVIDLRCRMFMFSRAGDLHIGKIISF